MNGRNHCAFLGLSPHPLIHWLQLTYSNFLLRVAIALVALISLVNTSMQVNSCVQTTPPVALPNRWELVIDAHDARVELYPSLCLKESRCWTRRPQTFPCTTRAILRSYMSCASCAGLTVYSIRSLQRCTMRQSEAKLLPLRFSSRAHAILDSHFLTSTQRTQRSNQLRNYCWYSS